MNLLLFTGFEPVLKTDPKSATSTVPSKEHLKSNR